MKRALLSMLLAVICCALIFSATATADELQDNQNLDADMYTMHGRNFVASTKNTTKTKGSAKSEKKMKVTVKATCKNRNHVGNNWSYEYKIDDEVIKNNSTMVIAAGQELIIESEVVENDKYPDIGFESVEYIVTEEDIRDGFKIELYVEVTEDKGRYAGCSCIWEIVYNFK